MSSPLEEFTREGVMRRANQIVGEYRAHPTQERFIVEERIKVLVRSMVKDLKRHHDQGFCVSAFSHRNYEISNSGRGRLVGVSHIDKDENSIQLNYADLHGVVLNTIFRHFRLQDQVPADWKCLLMLMKHYAVGNEYLICNHTAMMPIQNRVLFFIKAYEHVKFSLARSNKTVQTIIYGKLPYLRDWSDILKGNRLLEASFAYKTHDVSGNPEGFFDFYRHTNSHRLDRCFLIPEVGGYTAEQFEMILIVRYPLYLARLAEVLHEQNQLEHLEPHTVF